MIIYLKESTLVAPAAETPSLSLRSSNLDLVMASTHMASVYFYRNNGKVDFFDAPALRTALSLVLVHFYPLAGRQRMGEDGRLEIDCNAKGVLFVAAESDAKLDDLGDFAPSTELRRLVPTVDYSQGVSEYPLSVVQITRFNCGGVCLGVGMHHNVVDGYSGLHFINSWSRVARGLDITAPPFIDRGLLTARRPPRPQFKHIEYEPSGTTSRRAETLVSMFKLTQGQLKELKCKCTEDENKGTPTLYEALSAHIWLCVCRARFLPEVHETRLYIAVDGRTRLRPPLPQWYFGNVIFTATLVCLCGDLESGSTRSVAGEIHKGLTRMDDEYLRSALDFLEVTKDLKALVRSAHTYGNPNLGITSWAKLPVYEADFGWGKPFFMGPAAIPFEGLCYILGSPVNDGGVAVVIRLETEHMELFRKLFYDI